MTQRIRTDFWVAALRRRAEAAGAFVAIARRGAAEAGAIYVLVTRSDGRADLYGPAPQSVFDEAGMQDRRFMPVARDLSGADIRARLEREVAFDPDVWVVDIEDGEGQSLLDIVDEAATGAFTFR